LMSRLMRFCQIIFLLRNHSLLQKMYLCITRCCGVVAFSFWGT
jgi:hypothetical protein